eukprot:comp21751_c0_seq1/m.30811 comp21751_c0_seq1/g.30811  ORF comp21751_c0_seq1/g.30811 comp21751_c0_seq1/m.30811 type:complete len:351 (-) comp21751_c0_seq1:364-1416(-)
MAADNLTAILYGINDLRMEHRDRRPPGSGEVELEMKSVGICGSDVHYWCHGCIGDFVVKSPMVIGHEPSAVVVALGEGVTNLKVGDRVAIEPGVPCRRCDHCKTGRYNLCPDVTFCATPPVHGCLQRYYTHAADFCHKLPDNVSHEEGALVEPLSVGVHACRRAGVALGMSVLVCGAGPIGLVTLLVARAMGASKVIVTDVREERLKVAREMGAYQTLLVDGGDPKEAANQITTINGRPVDVAIDCTGIESAVRTAVHSTKSGGVVVCVGMGKPDINFPILEATWREVDIRGIFRYSNTYPTAINMISSRVVDVKPLITHRFSLDQSLEAFEVAKTGRDGAIKVMINVAP